jgi:uncharacterized protein YaaQ
MKLIIVIVHKRDEIKVSDALLQSGHKFTITASTGGFLRDGNVTMLIGAKEDQVDEIIDLVKNYASEREHFVTQPPQEVVGMGTSLMNPVKVSVGGAVVFVVDVERFERV